jgi:hypothetical protein
MVDLAFASAQCEHAWTPGRALVGALGLMAAVAAAVAWSQGPALVPVLHASTSARPSTDLDADGLDDQLELRLGTSPARIDSDGDGVSDPEEVARGSQPTSSSSMPGPDPLGVGLEVYQNGGPLKLVSFFYVGDGNMAAKTISMGARVGSVVRVAPISYFTQAAKFTTLAGKAPGSVVLVIDAPVDPLLVERFGSMSFFTSLANLGKVTDAAVVDLAWKGLMLEYLVEKLPSALHGHQTGGISTARYEPIDPSAVPPDWVPNQICAQAMAVSASVGPVLIQEVIEADCESGWDSYCDPGCPATVGTTVETLDPGALIGG